MPVLKEQYNYIRSAREVVLTHLTSLPETDLNSPVAAFNNKSISFMLVHICNVYIHWAGNYALGKGLQYHDEQKAFNLEGISTAFENVNELMDEFFTNFEGKLLEEITAKINGQMVTGSPLKVFTHVITHEFHHKGQLMSMTRLLGSYPPDTDVIRT
ncbi:MAG: hypothetical protein EOP48_29155 [Sphingobacteriales bacterium]|nr:MAG: hypothetical protein EOP48_29155 [Sphingobacteriales bacterium]